MSNISNIISVSLFSLFIFTKAHAADSLLAKPSKVFYAKHKGYMGSVEAGLLVGFEKVYAIPENCYYCEHLGQRKENLAVSLRTVHGYRFFPYLFVGGGVGFDRYTAIFQSYVPLFVRLQSEFLKKKITPFVAVDAGYSFLVQFSKQENIVYTKNEGGVYVAAMGGVKVYTRSRAAVSFQLGYTMHRSATVFHYQNIQDFYYTINRTLQRMSVGVGVSF